MKKKRLTALLLSAVMVLADSGIGYGAQSAGIQSVVEQSGGSYEALYDDEVMTESSDGGEESLEATGSNAVVEATGSNADSKSVETGAAKSDRVPLEGIQLSIGTEATLYVGERLELDVLKIPEDAVVENEEIQWESSNPDVAYVYQFTPDDKGRLYGTKEGETIITATLKVVNSEDDMIDSEENSDPEPVVYTASCKVTVKKTNLKGIGLNEKNLVLSPGRSYQMEISMEPEDPTADITNVDVKDAKWSIVSFGDSEAIASVDEKGVVTAHMPGWVSVKAELAGKTATCQVEVIETWKLSVMADGYEKVIDILKAVYVPQFRIPKTAELQELSEESRGYFSVQPKLEGLSARFTFKPSDKPVKAQLPLIMTGGENSEYKYSVILEITGQSLVPTASRTEDEIREFFTSHPFRTTGSDSWTVTPNGKREVAGKLTEESVTNGLNALNFARYIAGIPSNVTNNKEYEEYTQTGTTILQLRNAGLSHYPGNPGVSEEFYKKGYTGTSKSNLGQGHANLADAVFNGWMEDSDETNIDRVGHRRWCLDPDMRQTGFGHSGSYTGMYSLDSSNHRDEKSDYTYISWPARTMPVDYFQGAWSVSLNNKIYSVTDGTVNEVEVVLTSEKKGKSYTLDKDCTDKSGKYFNVEAGGYGFGPAIIFEPNVTFSSGDKVSVKITGLKDQYGNDLAPIEYTVTFFSMKKTGGGGNSSGGSSGGGSSSGGGGGSSSGGGGGGGSSSGTKGQASGVGPAGSASGSLPSYVVTGNWTMVNGQWQFADAAGQQYRNRWAAVSNPYANTAAGQSNFDWFYFDAAGNMQTGWFRDGDGNYYYLNPASDGTRGRMMTGWVWIADEAGVSRCYYLNPVSDGYRGRMLSNTVIDGYTINAQGFWTVNGVVQTK